MIDFIKGVIKGTGYALNGLFYAFKIDAHFRLHFFIWFSLSLISALLLKGIEKPLLVTINYLVIVFELTNTAIEKAVDTATKEWNINAKYAKDMGAGITFLIGVFAGVMDLVYLLPAVIKLLS